MTRSITRRNFWGGFWGGVIGILATAMLGGLALAVGCLVGVVQGFYYQELWQLAKDEHRKAIDAVRTGSAAWTALHSYEKAKKIKNMAVISGALTAAFLVICGILIWSPRGDDAFAAWAFGFYCTFMSFVPNVFRFDSEPSDRENGWGTKQLRYYWKLQALYINAGGNYLFAREYALTIGYMLLPAILVVSLFGVMWVLVTLWKITLAVLGIGLLGVLCFGFMRGVYRLAMRSDHWSCITVTISVTGLVALFGHEYLDGAALGLTCLMAGLLSGAGSVKAHPILYQYFASRPRLARFFARSAQEHGATFLEIGRALILPRRYQLRVRAIIARAVQ